jgi:hypothetical protein
MTAAAKKPGGALNNAPDNVRSLATLMLKGNCNMKKTYFNKQRINTD